MFQVIFNPISAREMSQIPRTLQLEILSEFHFLPEDLEQLDQNEHFGQLKREGKNLYRYRSKDYRIYFDRCKEGITVHRVLHKNTLSDFLFRSNLPLPTHHHAEDEALKQASGFWQLIEEGEKARPA